jgi:MerR family redox-sensitive transcriptional activator SoxR
MPAAPSNDPLLPIGEVAARSGVAASALRFYESLGLIHAVRQAGGRRFYPRSTLRRIAFVVFAQRIGCSLTEITQQVKELCPDRPPTKADWQRQSQQWRARVRQKIEELRRLDMALDHCIGCGCLSLERCWLSNPGDRAGQAGPGPRRWLGDPMPD